MQIFLDSHILRLKKLELEKKASKRKANTSRSNVSTSTSEEEENHGWELVEDLELKESELKGEMNWQRA